MDTNDNEGDFILDRNAARAALKTGLFIRVEREGDVIGTLYSLDGSVKGEAGKIGEVGGGSECREGQVTRRVFQR